MIERYQHFLALCPHEVAVDFLSLCILALSDPMYVQLVPFAKYVLLYPSNTFHIPQATITFINISKIRRRIFKFGLKLALLFSEKGDIKWMC